MLYVIVTLSSDPPSPLLLTSRSGLVLPKLSNKINQVIPAIALNVMASAPCPLNVTTTLSVLNSVWR